MYCAINIIDSARGAEVAKLMLSTEESVSKRLEMDKTSGPQRTSFCHAFGLRVSRILTEFLPPRILVPYAQMNLS